MVAEWVWSILLETASAAAAGVGFFRVQRTARLVDDLRVTRLAAFFALIALAAAVHVLSVAHWETRGALVADAAFGVQDLLFWLQHALFVTALTAGILAYGPPRRVAPAAALAPVLLVAEPVLRILETLAAAYLFVRTLVNHARKESLGSLTVAVGFLALLLGQSLFLYNQAQGPDPLGARSPWGEAFVFLGLLVLASATPGRPMRSG
jgi:hypothetical protein